MKNQRAFVNDSHMAIFTTAQRDEIAAALVQLATDGIESVTVGGQTVKKMQLSELAEALKAIDSELAAQRSHFGLRMTKLVPPGTG